MTISGFSEKKILLYNDQWTIKIQTWSSPLCRQVWCQVCMKSGVISAPPHTLREYSTSSYIARIQHLLIHCEDTAPHIARIQFLSCFMSYIARIQSPPSRIQNILYYSSKDTDTMYHPLQGYIYTTISTPLLYCTR